MNPPKPPHGPDPLDEAVAAFRAMPVPPCPAGDDWAARMVPGPSPATESPPHSRRSLLVRIVPLSAAAAVLVAAGFTAFFAGPASVALGDVVKAAERHKLVRYHMAQGGETRDGSSVQPLTQVAHADLRAPRFRTDHRSPGSLQGAIDFESIYVMDGVKGVTMQRLTETVTEKGKTDPEAIKILKDFEHLGVPRKIVTLTDFYGDLTPASADRTRSILENLRDLEAHKDAVATRGKFRGADVLKYRIEEGPRTTTLWVDAATKLPVRMEYESTDPKDTGGGEMIKTKYVMSDFEWDPALEGFKDIDELFSTEPAAGYKVEDRRKPKENAGQ